MCSIILVVDDDENLCRMVADLLTTEGYIVFIANDGREALEMLQDNYTTWTPDLIVSGIHMPRMDGYEFLTAIRGASNFGKLKFIVLTKVSDRPSVRLALQLGADGYLTKPFDADDLLILIEYKLGKRKPADYVERAVKLIMGNH